MNKPKRLDKCLSDLTNCTRNEAQRYIKNGWVRVDGLVENRPNFKVQDQKVALDTNASLEPAPLITILLNLPEGFDSTAPTAPLQLITPETRSSDDTSGIILQGSNFSRLSPTVPLEEGATGLLVFSEDFKIIRRLVQNAKKNEQEYIVEVSDEIDTDSVKQLNLPMTNNGWPLPGAKVSKHGEKRLRFALNFAQSGQIRHMCKNAGLNITSIKRIRIGSVPMAKLPAGRWRHLPEGLMF